MITLISYSGKHGSMVYLRNYLSVMFNISDVMIDKEEIAMKMQLPIHITENTLPNKNNSECVPESHIKAIVRKVAEILEIQGISCCRCPKTKYILSPLSACKDSIYLYSLRIICPWGKAAYQFELKLKPENHAITNVPGHTLPLQHTLPAFAESPEVLLKGGVV